MQEVDRTRRVAELLKRELASLIAHDLNDKRINTVTLTSVTVSRDLKYAKVYFSSIDCDLQSDQIEKLLNNSARYLRFQIAKVVELRTAPRIEFRYDNSLKRGSEMSNLIDKLNR